MTGKEASFYLGLLTRAFRDPEPNAWAIALAASVGVPAEDFKADWRMVAGCNAPGADMNSVLAAMEKRIKAMTRKA